MAEVVVSVVEGDEATEQVIEEPKALEAAVDVDLAAFDQYFQKVLLNDPLSPSEKAVLKTYLWWKTHPESPNAR